MINCKVYFVYILTYVGGYCITIRLNKTLTFKFNFIKTKGLSKLTITIFKQSVKQNKQANTLHVSIKRTNQMCKRVKKSNLCMLL